ncbi:MAG: hypothetical protein ACLUVC_04890 [Longibaculum sp.]
MKKLLLLCLSLLVMFGCQSKPEEEKPTSAQEVFGEDYENGGATGIKNYKVVDNLVELELLYEKRPIGKDHMMMIMQDNTFVPFSFEKDKEFDLTQKFNMKTEKLENNKLYVKVNTIKKGEPHNFYVFIVCNPTYMPKESQNIIYDDLEVMADGQRTITFDQDIINKEETKAKAFESQWESVKDVSGGFSQVSLIGYENKDQLISILQGSTMATPAIQVHKNKGFQWTVAIQKGEFKNPVIYFFIDNQPIKIQNDYDYLSVPTDKEGFILTDVQLTLPKDIGSGNHTFYAYVFETEGKVKNEKGVEIRMLDVGE